MLIDDLANSNSSAEARNRKDLGMNILRFAANDSNRDRLNPDRTVNTQICNAGLAFTGEYSLTNPSDITRTIMVNITKQMENGTTKDRSVAATAFRYFLLWFLPKTDDYLNILRQEMSQISEDECLRLRKSRMLILWAIETFFDFARECNGISKKENKDLSEKVNKFLNKIVDYQTELIEKNTMNICICSYILEGIRNEKIKCITGSQWDKAEKRAKKDKESKLPAYFYVKDKDTDSICIQSKILLKYLNNETNLSLKSDKEMNRKLNQELDRDLKSFNKENRSAEKRISKSRKRFLQFNRSELEHVENQQKQ